MRYLSVCSGIEAATVAWHPLGWTPAAFSEIEAFPRAVLAHHYPTVPCHGDFTTIQGDEYGPIDLLVGGTPCQSFSVAGLRGGIHDDRGNLALEFLRLLDRTRPSWVVWENVPGVFSSLSHDAPDQCPPDIDLDADDAPQDGEEVVVTDEYDADESHAFACFLAGLSELGYGAAYRVFDAQYAGVPQRRRRVFVVGHLGDWRRAAAVLFERHSLSGDTPPCREKGQNAPTIPSRSTAGGGLGTDFDCDGGLVIPQGCGGETAPTLNAAYGSKLGLDNQHIDSGAGLFVAHSLRAEGFDASEDGTGRGTPLVPVAFAQNSRVEVREITGNIAGALAAEPGMKQQTYIAFTAKDHGADASDISPTLRSGSHDGSHANGGVMPAVAFQQTADCLYAAYGTKWNGNAAADNGSLFVNHPAVAFTASEQANSYAWERDVYPTLNAQVPNDSSNIQQGIRLGSAVRRLTPRECERLQGFPDGYTAVPYRGKPAADGPRYKALGNSMAVPVMRWIGERIQLVASLEQDPKAA